MILQLLRLPLLPAQLLHEVAHVLAAAPWSQHSEVVVGPADSRAAMETIVEFEDDAPRLAIAWTYLAPAITGLVGALIGGYALMVGAVDAPRSVLELLLWSAMTMAWAIYTRPSRSDLAGAVHALEADDDG